MNRMEEAIVLADRCWGKASRAEPEFVEQYLASAEELLVNRPIVMGDEFRAQAELNGLRLPNTLHHNTWVSGARAMQQIGWTSPISKVEPMHSHNHMPSVTLWRSNIFGNEQVPFSSGQQSLF